MSLSRLPSSLRLIAVVLAGVAIGVAFAARPFSQGAGPPAYTIMSADGRRVVPFRMAGSADLLPLDQLADIFGLSVREDALAGGLIVRARGATIALTPGQPLASVGGRLVSLSGSVLRDGRSWYVPADFLSRAVGPALNLRIDVRRGSRLIVVGDLRIPRVTVHIERQAPSGRLLVETQPATARHVTRDGMRLVIRFEADGLDAAPVTGALPEFVGGVHVDGASLVLDLGPLATNYSVNDDRGGARFSIDLLAPGVAVPAARPAPPQEPTFIPDLAPSGVIRTVVIDPGHGGDDAGARGAAGTIEKDLTLQMARRLKTAIESRIGLRVLLSREGDENVDADRRTAFANNNQADLLLSLHANASFRPAVRGAQVLSLSLEDYKDRAQVLGANGPPVPVVSGGARLIEAVPWELAQIRHVTQSATLGAIVIRHFTEQNVPLYLRPVDQAPLRILAGANMPAIVVELGFLSNRDDERALTSDETTAAIINALVATVVEIRGGIPAARGGGPDR